MEFIDIIGKTIPFFMALFCAILFYHLFGFVASCFIFYIVFVILYCFMKDV